MRTNSLPRRNVKAATEGLGWLLFLVSLYLLVRCGQAQAEEPCRRTGDEVTCEAAGFKVLTDRLVDLQTAVGVCRYQLRDATERAAGCRADCAALVPPTVPPAAVAPPTQSSRQALTGAALVAIGAAGVVLAASLSDVGTDWRAGLAAAGLVGLSVGVVLVVP